MDDSPPCASLSHAPLQVLPVIFVTHQKADKHARIHLADVQPSKAPRVVRRQLLGAVRMALLVPRRLGAWSQAGPRLVWVQVEEAVSLRRDKVVRRRRAATTTR
ncbi:hypothetical protein GTR04_5368 [Trichophyton interdigitale]|nr:hypothetical protein GTR04_5368 [Trichophyton interdigitale]